MDTWLYVFIAVIALLSFILCLNVRIIICYEGGKLVYYARILVFKLKIDLNKKKKSRQNESNDKSIVDQLLGVRKSLVKSLGGFMKKRYSNSSSLRNSYSHNFTYIRVFRHCIHRKCQQKCRHICYN